jgi:uncharacterized protein (TIGR02271 family)
MTLDERHSTMTDARIDDYRGWIGRKAVDRNGDKIGRIDDIYADDDTGQPEWLTVHTGMFGGHMTFVPLRGAQMQGDDLMVAYDKDQVKDAPRAEADGHLTEQEEDRLYEYYGMGAGFASTGDRDMGGMGGMGAGDVSQTGTIGMDSSGTTGLDTGGTAGGMGTMGNDATQGDLARDTTRGTEGYDTSGPTTDDAMTRSEEEVQIGTHRRESGRARLRKWVETEQVERTVPVQREEVRVVKEPITEGNRDAAMSGPDLSGEEHEVVLHEEEVDVQKRVVPKERVRLETETVTEQVPVTEEVRKERIATEGDRGVDQA